MTRVVIAGGHGKIALILERLLSQRGDSVAGLIRSPPGTAGQTFEVICGDTPITDAVASVVGDREG